MLIIVLGGGTSWKNKVNVTGGEGGGSINLYRIFTMLRGVCQI